MKRAIATTAILLLSLCFVGCKTTDLQRLQIGLSVAQTAIGIVNDTIGTYETAGVIPHEDAQAIRDVSDSIKQATQKMLDYSQTLTELDLQSKTKLLGFLDPAIASAADIASKFVKNPESERGLLIAVVSVQTALKLTKVILTYTDAAQAQASDAQLKQTAKDLKTVKQ